MTVDNVKVVLGSMQTTLVKVRLVEINIIFCHIRAVVTLDVGLITRLGTSKI